MLAVIKTGGKQYLVKEGQTLNVELLKEEVGKTVEFDVLLITDEKGEEVKLGTPLVSGAKVSASIVESGKGKKVSVIKYKPKTRYRRNVGHRQPYTKIKIEKITV
jgi:large subunit ribosomal protein L21